MRNSLRAERKVDTRMGRSGEGRFRCRKKEEPKVNTWTSYLKQKSGERVIKGIRVRGRPISRLAKKTWFAISEGGFSEYGGAGERCQIGKD